MLPKMISFKIILRIIGSNTGPRSPDPGRKAWSVLEKRVDYDFNVTKIPNWVFYIAIWIRLWFEIYKTSGFPNEKTTCLKTIIYWWIVCWKKKSMWLKLQSVGSTAINWIAFIIFFQIKLYLSWAILWEDRIVSNALIGTWTVWGYLVWICPMTRCWIWKMC